MLASSADGLALPEDGGADDPGYTLGAFAWGAVWLDSFAAALALREVRKASGGRFREPSRNFRVGAPRDARGARPRRWPQGGDSGRARRVARLRGVRDRPLARHPRDSRAVAEM